MSGPLRCSPGLLGVALAAGAPRSPGGAAEGMEGASPGQATLGLWAGRGSSGSEGGVLAVGGASGGGRTPASGEWGLFPGPGLPVA